MLIDRLRKISSWFLFRLACFVLLTVLAQHAPRWLERPLWLVAFSVGAWAFVALVRESGQALDRLLPWLQRRWAFHDGGFRGAGKVIGLLCVAVIVTVALYRAWPVWSFKATSSLREDEIMNVARYTSKGFVRAVSTYSVARNHVFYNIVSSFIPGADSTMPFRARLLSFVLVVSSLLLLVVYAAKRRWLLPGLACAGLLAGSLPAMDSLLEARGYGLIFLFAMVGCVTFCEWVREPSRIRLNILATSCVLGTYTLPFYVWFGGSLLLLAFFYRPSKDTFLAGFLSLAAIALLYLPIGPGIYAVFEGYANRYENTVISQFQSIDGVYSSLQFFLPREVIEISAQTFILLSMVTLLYISFGRFAAKSDRICVAGVTISTLAFLAFCLYCQVVPQRVASYIAAPLTFLTMLVVGSIVASKPLLPFRPLTDLLITALAVAIMLKSQAPRPLMARADWRSLGVLIERAFPADIRIGMTGDLPQLIEWNLVSRTKPERDTIDRAALSEGKMVAVEGFTAPAEEGHRFRWDDLPEEVRFVTSPIALNYHRVFFVPPKQTGIASISVNDRPVETRVPGRQPYDPALLAHSFGHGDVLRPRDPGDVGRRFASPSEMPLPATIVVNLEGDGSRGTCNLLFTQGLQDKKIEAKTRNSGGDWRRNSNVFVLGELVSIALNQPGCEAVQVRIESDPSSWPTTDRTTRPPFGLLDAWFAAGRDRLP